LKPFGRQLEQWREISDGIGGPQMKSDVALSEKEDFPKMQDIAMTSWTQCNNYVRIQKTVEKDFEG
jgi:hypothetical protein